MTSIDNAPKEVQLAVDLIYLLETNEVDPHIALKALEIVKKDLLAKSAKSDNAEANALL
ncbi:pleiotropic regulatory protein RsmS [Vibrio salinus]|uniref:pleiotropic regulatory protein RsmS n=1 Tax=Vibrio salinus TaxID=2899784 RepID=UPI001E394739|nr:pleiotropic regulatory protein RsmS [Vibrio salinus]MCE0492834.1 pleiotropic regulatory protein RsmS [Vibrio salinus]